MSIMNADQYRQVQELFLRLREIESGEDREAALANVGSGIGQEVRALLVADAHRDGFLEPARPSAGARSSAESIPPTRAFPSEDDGINELPRWIDRYRLLQRIGEGGHGTVFMAQQSSPIERLVAVKLIKPGMDSRQVLARFHAEQQALAMMDHASIARVFDAGTTSAGAPYFVMELVKGIPITEFCETNQLDLADRLRLFVQVCQAVHHAHQKGVIHRDLKPSNILVTMSDGGPLAKVIDFGIAKALDTRLTDRTLFTEFGQMIGTLEYMSPEQAEMSTVDVDTRSDVYSLGVLLYELLTGTPPITRDQLLRDGLWEISHRLRDTEPPKPSTRITESRQQLTRVGKHGRRHGRGVMQLPNRDLDWVTMMALEKDRRRRYDSARDLGRDIERFLEGDPIAARPPSWSYLLGKTVRRHKMVCGAVALATVVVVVALAGLTWGLQVARQQALRATVERVRAENASRRLAETVYSELVESAWEAGNNGNAARANELLQNCLPKLRGWEWDLVHDRIASAADQSIRPASGSAVVAMDFATTAKWTACVLENGQIEVWDVGRRRIIQTLNFPTLANTARFSPDESILYVGLRNSRLLAWDTVKWRQLWDQPLEGTAYDLTCSDDGSYLAVCTGAGCVSVMRRDTRAWVDQWRLKTRLGHLAFDPSAGRLVGTGLDGEVYIFRLGDAEYQHRFVGASSLGPFVWLDDEELAVLVDRSVVVVPMKELKDELHELSHLEALATCTAWMPSSGALLVGGSDGKLIRIDPGDRSKSGILVQQYSAAIRDVQCLNPQGQLLVALTDGRLVLSALEPRDNTVNLKCKARITSGVALTRRSEFVTTDDTGWLRLWSAPTGDVVREVHGHTDSVWSIDASRDEGRLATVGDDFRLRLWNASTLQQLLDVEIGLGVRAVAWEGRGRYVVAAPPPGDNEGVIGIWDVAQGTCTRRLIGHENWVMQLAFSVDGQTLVSTDANGSARVWDFDSGTCRFELQSPTGSAAIHIAIEDQGKQLFLGHRDGRVTVWHLATGDLLHEWSAFGDSLSGLELTPGGDRLLVTSQSDARLKVWDTGLQAAVATLDLGDGYLAAFRLSPDGRWFATMGSDGVVHVRQLMRTPSARGDVRP